MFGMVVVERRYGLGLGCCWRYSVISIRIIPTLQLSHFGRIYAAYGGIFIISSIVWGIIADKKKPDRFEIMGSLVAVSGAIIIFYIPR
jgi:small multidrug resistance family-3 protein